MSATRPESVPATAGAADFKPLPMKRPDIEVERRPDGCILIRSRHAPGMAPRSITHLFAERVAEHPDRPLLLQRAPGHGPWRGVTYGQASRAAEGVAQWLIDRGLGASDSVMVISGNSVEHGLMMLGCYAAGVPIAPISAAYSLLGGDYAKLRDCFCRLRPKLVFAQSGGPFAGALATLRAIDPGLVVVLAEPGDSSAVPLSELIERAPVPADIAAARERIGEATVAKYLFTSGSTGTPKATPQTHGMMVHMIAAQNGLRTDGEASIAEGAASLEWMPWSHISAGNIKFNNNLWHGGVIYLDEGRPTPDAFETTIQNLYEVSPAAFGSAPVAYAMLVPALERDPALRRSFFRNLAYMSYGGAVMASDLYARLQALAVAETGRRIPLTTMYGATETQGIAAVHWETEQAGLIGLPYPGATLKLVPDGHKYEVRAKAPTITRGYFGDPERTAQAFDEEGFYRLGDAARFLDPDRPHLGLVFDGRVSEDFKLETGTWVSVGTLRPQLLAACSPYLQDAVITGQDRGFVGALLWPATAPLQVLVAELGETGAWAKLSALIAARLVAFNADAGGSSRRIGRFRLLEEPASMDGGELTDKGYVNQRRVLERRADLVAELYRDPPGHGVDCVA
jgi:feruloyl-CoA synthase